MKDIDVSDSLANDELEMEDDGPPPNVIKKKEIYDHVTVATGLRKREVREAIDATFAYLFDCLSDGKDVQCSPLGKLRSINKGDEEKAKMLYKIVLQKPGSGKQDEEEVLEAELD